MWFLGTVQIKRRVKFETQKLLGKTTWKSPPATPYGANLDVTPYEFLFGAIRTAAIGTRIGLRGQLAGGFLGSSAMMYLKVSSTSPRTLRLHHRFYNLKDFIGTAFKGNIGAAIAYVEMQKQGYTWAAHWEDCYPSGGSDTRPDFVFGKNSAICLVDAKGSAAVSAINLEKHTRNEWTRQIKSNWNKPLKGGGVPNEGMVISTHVRNDLDANIIVAYGKKTAPAPIKTTPQLIAETSVVAADPLYIVQRANFISSCFLLGFHELASSLLSERPAGFQLLQRAKRVHVNDGSYIIGTDRKHIYPSIQWLGQPPGSPVFMMEEEAFLASYEKFRDPAKKSGDLLLPEFDMYTQIDQESAFVRGRDGVAMQFSGSLLGGEPLDLSNVRD